MRQIIEGAEGVFLLIVFWVFIPEYAILSGLHKPELTFGFALYLYQILIALNVAGSYISFMIENEKEKENARREECRRFPRLNLRDE